MVCEQCYQADLPQLKLRNLQFNPLVGDSECGLCTRKPSRFSKDMDMGFCDHCQAESQRIEQSYADSYVPKSRVFPDLIDDDFQLFVGQKDSAYDLRVLQILNITHIIVCCSALPLYCLLPRAPPRSSTPEDLSDEEEKLFDHNYGKNSVFTHRLPMADSLDQNLLTYLPVALRIIDGLQLDSSRTGYKVSSGSGDTSAVDAGCPTREVSSEALPPSLYHRRGGVLVHCNAGVSRSGAVAIGWLMHHYGWGYDRAASHAKSKRKCIFPNSNFIEQLQNKGQA